MPESPAPAPIDTRERTTARRLNPLWGIRPETQTTNATSSAASSSADASGEKPSNILTPFNWVSNSDVRVPASSDDPRTRVPERFNRDGSPVAQGQVSVTTAGIIQESRATPESLLDDKGEPLTDDDLTAAQKRLTDAERQDPRRDQTFTPSIYGPGGPPIQDPRQQEQQQAAPQLEEQRAFTPEQVREMLADPIRPPMGPNDPPYPGWPVTRRQAEEMLANPIRPPKNPNDPPYPADAAASLEQYQAGLRPVQNIPSTPDYPPVLPPAPTKPERKWFGFRKGETKLRPPVHQRAAMATSPDGQRVSTPDLPIAVTSPEIAATEKPKTPRGDRLPSKLYKATLGKVFGRGSGTPPPDLLKTQEITDVLQQPTPEVAKPIEETSQTPDVVAQPPTSVPVTSIGAKDYGWPKIPEPPRLAPLAVPTGPTAETPLLGLYSQPADATTVVPAPLNPTQRTVQWQLGATPTPEPAPAPTPASIETAEQVDPLDAAIDEFADLSPEEIETIIRDAEGGSQ